MHLSYYIKQVSVLHCIITDQSDWLFILRSNHFFFQNWTDVHLRWNVTEFHGVKKINIPATEIWTPDLRLYNL